MGALEQWWAVQGQGLMGLRCPPELEMGGWQQRPSTVGFRLPSPWQQVSPAKRSIS